MTEKTIIKPENEETKARKKFGILKNILRAMVKDVI